MKPLAELFRFSGGLAMLFGCMMLFISVLIFVIPFFWMVMDWSKSNLGLAPLGLVIALCGLGLFYAGERIGPFDGRR